MRLLIITPYYTPDGGPSAPLFALLAEALVKRGHAVTVIAAVPHYPSGQAPDAFRKLRAVWSVEHGVKICRVPVPSVRRSNLALRLLQLLCYQVGAALAGWRQSYDIVLASNPFFMTGLPFATLSFFRKKASIYAVYDVYPDVALSLGILKPGLITNLVSALEEFCVRRASCCRIISESFRPAVMRLGAREEKCMLVYDWVDTDLIRPLPKRSPFACQYGLADKFVVLYAGNFGLSQGLEHVITAADLLRDQPEILFVFVGEGKAKEALVRRAGECGLTNVLFLPFQPRNRLAEVLASADLCLVMLQKGIGRCSLPSKIYSILAGGRPILASIDEDSDAARLVMRAGAGLCIPPEDPTRLVEGILKIKNHPELAVELGNHGRSHALMCHSPEAAAAQFEALLQAALNAHGTPEAAYLEREA